MIKKVKNTVPWTYFISYLNGKYFFGVFYHKNSKKQIKKHLELKKQSIENFLNYMLN